MLKYLRVAGVGPIEEGVLYPSRGFTAVTGETGVGKTLMVSSLGLLCHDRARGERIRAGSREAVVEACFELPEPGVMASEEGVGGSREVVYGRVVDGKGRSRAYKDGVGVPVSLVAREVGALVDFNGQARVHLLRQPSYQEQVLDEFGGIDSAAFRDARAKLAELKRKTERGPAEGVAARRELACLREGTEVLGRLESRFSTLEEVEERIAVLEEVVECQEEVAVALKLMEEAAASAAAAWRKVKASKPLLEYASRLEAVSIELEDMAAEVAARVSEPEAAQGELDELRDAAHALKRLYRDLGIPWGRDLGSVRAELGARVQALEEELATYEHLPRLLQEAEARLARERERLVEARRQAAERLERQVNEMLADLAFEGARLEVAVDPKVEFLFSSSLLLEPAPLSSVASGGELSRVCLALDAALMRGEQTIVFDEIDAGVGGRAAIALGKVLARLAQGCQVIAVTHLPQVAAFADCHYVVERTRRGGKDVAVAREVTGEERVAEIARMLSGLEGSEVAAEHARALLAQARELAHN